MTFKNKLGLEAVNYQGSSSLFARITKEIERIRTAGVYTDETFKDGGLAGDIETECGLSPRFNIVDSSFINAAVKVPQLDKNNPLINNYERVYRANDDLKSIGKFVKGEMFGTVDRKNSYFGGIFKQLTFDLYLTRGLLSSPDFTPAEIAAVILHELGHVGCYYERLADLASSNYAAMAAAERVLKLERDTDRIQLVTEYEKMLGVKIPDQEIIINAKSTETVYIKLVTDTIKARRNVEGDEIYSYRGFEFSADQFATRHGAGRDLVTALDKIQRAGFLPESYTSWPVHVACELVKAVMYFTVVGFGIMWAPQLAVLGIISILMARPMEKIYDDPEERAIRIRNELVGELKNPGLLPVRRNQILADIGVIDDVLTKTVDKRTLLEAVWAYVIPSGRRARQQMEFQQQLERLANNELFVSAAKLENLAKA